MIYAISCRCRERNGLTMVKILCLTALLLLGLTGCGARPPDVATPTAAPIMQPLPPGDAERGESLFRQTLIGERPEPGCSTCHSLAPDVVLLGPSLAGVATRSADTLQEPTYAGEATTVEAYLHESIIAPNVYVVPGFAPDVMRPTFATELSSQVIADLIAFLLTHKG